MERPMNNTKSTRTPTLPEQFGDNKSSLLLPQVQVNNQFNNRLTLYKPITTPANKYLHHQLPLSSDAMTIYLAPTNYVREIFSGTLNVMASKSTTPHKLT
jgi:hypothetical protein